MIEREREPVTVSIGVCETAPRRADPVPDAIWDAVDQADQALYVAKNAGRNRVVLSSGLLESCPREAVRNDATWMS